MSPRASEAWISALAWGLDPIVMSWLMALLPRGRALSSRAASRRGDGRRGQRREPVLTAVVAPRERGARHDRVRSRVARLEREDLRERQRGRVGRGDGAPVEVVRGAARAADVDNRRARGLDLDDRRLAAGRTSGADRVRGRIARLEREDREEPRLTLGDRR